jgi:soluble lytic murein transglycosylase-like protein
LRVSVRGLTSGAFAVLLALAGLLESWEARAGAQQYEPLAASVQAALHSSVADRASPRLAFAPADDGQAWLEAMSARLARHMPDEQSRTDLLVTVQYEARRAGLDPQLILGVIDVESRFRKYAVSNAGARGYMQVMPFWVDLIGATEHNLFNLRTNLRYGCVVLRHYLDIEHGDLRRALARYNGSLGRASNYAGKVLQAWQTRWAWPAVTVREVSYTPKRPTRYLGAAQ